MRRIEVFQSSADHVYEELKNLIITKELRPGQRIPEISMARQLNVSRTPVREALRRLANEGLVDLIPNVGAQLASPTKQDIQDAFEMRTYLECMAVRKAVKRITPVQICMLEEQILAEVKVFRERDLEKYLDVNRAFHMIIAEASGNTVLHEYLGNILSRTMVYMFFFESFFDFDTNPSLEEHRQIVEALKARNEELVARIMEEHIMISEKQVEELAGRD
ncbi:MAG TPA: GntR family transcriptional regulator [Synergistales bacterium]|nr:GntR family transcriptional regulator [Synergistales bacterium]